MFDLLIRHGTIVDGTGRPAYPGAVACEGDKLRVLTESEAESAQAAETIDATGLAVCPGFIDAHSHGDRIIGTDVGRWCKTSQGVTTEIAGQCGSSRFPVTAENLELLRGLYQDGNPAWVTEHLSEFVDFASFVRYAQPQDKTLNSFILTGHSALRIAAMGFDKRPPTPAELEHMKAMLRTCMEQGSIGLSTGLLYSPSGYANGDEIAALCEVVAEYGGLYTTHMRDESAGVLASVEEALEVARRTGVRLCISHHKICGKSNWGLSRKTLAMIDAACAEGCQVTYDVYPYTASSSKLSVCLPAYCFAHGMDDLKKRLADPAYRDAVKEQMSGDDPQYDGRYRHCGGFGGILISNAPSTPEANGKTVAAYAAEIGKDEFDVFFDLLQRDGNGAYAIYFSMCDDDLFYIVQGKNALVGSDGVATSMTGKTHPRGWGAFPRAIRLYWRENHLFLFEEVIRRMTGMTAERLGVKNRGRIADGFVADLTLVNPETVSDRATYAAPTELSDGIERVIVSGKTVYADKKLTGAYPGRILRRGE